MKKVLLVSLIVLSSISAVVSQTVQAFVLQPPVQNLQGIKKIAILSFENFDKTGYYKAFGGDALVDYISASMLDETRGLYSTAGSIWSKGVTGKSYIKTSSINTLQLVERGQLNTILQEKHLGNDVALDQNQAADIGKVLGIDALIMGTVKHTYKSNRTPWKNADGSYSYCSENSCETEVMLKIVSVATAQVIATKSFKRSGSDKKCGTEEANVWTFEQFAQSNLKGIALDISAYLESSYLGFNIEFKKIKVDGFKEKAKQVKDYLNNGDLKSAYAIYKAIYDADNYNAEAAYNLAQLYFITGDYEECAKWDNTAFEIDAKEYGKANEAAKTWAGYSSALRDLGIVIDKYDFSTNKDALADKVKTRGSKSDRYDVFEKPDKTSASVAKIPGETEFVVIEKKGDFTLIKLLGGKQGYIPNENVK